LSSPIVPRNEVPSLRTTTSSADDGGWFGGGGGKGPCAQQGVAAVMDSATAQSVA